MRLQRLDCNPIITPDTHPSLGSNINGPSLIRVPEWLANPIGRYYLYFAHHQGQHIRLAYADELCGPWEVYERGVLHLDDTVCSGHIASPDLHSDDGRLRMYFHGPTDDGQKTFVATSTDGLSFEPRAEVLGPSYFRVFNWNGAYYAIARDGCSYRAQEPFGPFEHGPEVFERLRHCAVRIVGDTLQVFYCNVGDRPEHIVLSEIDLRDDWREWQPTEPETILMPEHSWEGVDLPVQTSKNGWAPEPVHELRDPAVYEEGERTWLLYSIAGESGLAIAEIIV
jgi:hypothetical protein